MKSNSKPEFPRSKLMTNGSSFHGSKAVKDGSFFPVLTSFGEKAMENRAFLFGSTSCKGHSKAVKKHEPIFSSSCITSNKKQKLMSVDPVSTDAQVEISSPIIPDDEALAKALHVVNLKCRYAELIAKTNDDKTFPKKAQQEREKLHKLHNEKNAVKELKKVVERKEEIQKKRKLARLELEELERSVQGKFFDEIKELEKLTNSYQSYTRHGKSYKTVWIDSTSGIIVFEGLLTIPEYENSDEDDDDEPILGCKNERCFTLDQSWHYETEKSEILDPLASCESEEPEKLKLPPCHKREKTGSSAVEDGEIVDADDDKPTLACTEKDVDVYPLSSCNHEHDGEVVACSLGCECGEGEILDSFLSCERDKCQSPNLISSHKGEKLVRFDMEDCEIIDADDEPLLSCTKRNVELHPLSSCNNGHRGEMLDHSPSYEHEEGEIHDSVLSCKRDECETLNLFCCHKAEKMVSFDVEDGEILD